MLGLCLFLLRIKSVSGQTNHGFADPGLASIQSRRLPICVSECKPGRAKDDASLNYRM